MFYRKIKLAAWVVETIWFNKMIWFNLIIWKKKKNNDGKCTESKQKKWWQWYVEKKKTLAKQNHKAQLKDNQMLKDKIKFFVF